MPLSSATITFDIADMLGVDYDTRRGIRAWVDTNIPGDTVIDTDGNKIRLGSGKVVVNADGTGTASVWIPGTGSNPASWQTYFHFEYVDSGDHKKGRQTRTFGPFTVTASGDLADLIEEQEVPPTYLSVVTDLLDGYVAEAETAATTAAASATSAAASASAASTITGLSGEDDAVALLVSTPSSDTATALAVKIAAVTAQRTLDDWAAGSSTGHYLHGVSSVNGLNLDPAGTLVAVENAILAHPQDVIMIDLDYRKTADGALASLHDTTTVNLSPTVVTVADVSFRDLPPVNRPGLYGSGWGDTPLGLIENILVSARGRCVFSIEIKDGMAGVPEATALAHRLGMADKIVWNTGDPTVVAAVTAAGCRAFMFNCNTTAKLDQAAAAGAWMVDVPTDASTAFIDYAISKGFPRIIRGFITTAGAPIATDKFSQVTGIDPRLDGFSSDATAYLDRPGGKDVRSRKSIAGSIRTGKRGPGWWLVNSSNITNWLDPGRLYTYRAGPMVYTFGDIAGTIGTTGTLTIKLIWDTLPTTLTQGTRFKLFSPTELPANASSDTIEGYVFGVPADGAIFCNSVPAGGGSPSFVFPNILAKPFVAATEYTITMDWDDTGGSQKMRVTRQDPFVTLSSAVSAGTVTSLPVNALPVAVPHATKFLLPDGTVVSANGTSALGATSLVVSSVTVPATASGSGLRLTSGWVTEGAKAIWRGGYHTAYTTQTTGVGALTDLAISTT